jgi:3-oxoacyl-[acyl-carrier protein] reductase
MSIPPPQELLDFTDRVVLITGAARGVGAGIARRFAQAGASMAINYRTSETDAATLVAAIQSAGGEAAAFQADVTQREDVARLIDAVVARFGRLDVLINNAGSYPSTSLLEMPDAEWDAVIAANLRSVHLCTQLAARQMIAQGEGGAVVNLTTIEAISPAPGHSHYDAAKAGVAMHTRAAAQELGQRGIRVNAVAPGLIWREGIEAAWPEGVERYRQAAPLGRLGRPEDVADACLFLASPAARWITGASLTVDGGVMIRPPF